MNEHEKGLKLEDANKKLEEYINELKKTIEHLQSDIQAWERKEKILLESLKTKGNDAYELQKKISEL